MHVHMETESEPLALWKEQPLDTELKQFYGKDGENLLIMLKCKNLLNMEMLLVRRPRCSRVCCAARLVNVEKEGLRNLLPLQTRKAAWCKGWRRGREP